jgi:hypothetical protein
VAQLHPQSLDYCTQSLCYDRRSVVQSAPTSGIRQDFYCCQTVAGFLICGSVSDERTGLSFTISAGPSQRSRSRVRAPWDSRPYFIVSDSRLPFLSAPATRRATVEVFDPTWTSRDPTSKSELCYDQRSVGQSVLVSSIHVGLKTRSIFLSDS